MLMYAGSLSASSIRPTESAFTISCKIVHRGEAEAAGNPPKVPSIEFDSLRSCNQMSKKDPTSMLECVGMTSENKQIIGGVYSLYETTGLPLDVILDCIHRKNAMVSWIHFYKEARSAGMKHRRILAKLKEAICDVWGLKFYEHVEEKLNLVFSDDKIHKDCSLRGDIKNEQEKMCQLEEMTTDEPSFREQITMVAKPKPITPDRILMINEVEDVSFPCTACGAYINRPCRKLM